MIIHCVTILPMSMFSQASRTLLGAILTLADVEQSTRLEQLDDDTRVRLMSILVGLVVVGVALMIFAWLGARVVRNYAGMKSTDSARTKKKSPDDDWWQKPLIPPAEDDSLE